MAHIRTEHTSFDSDVTVHPWNGLVHRLCNAIPPDEINRLIHLARRQLGEKFTEVLGQSVCQCESFFTALQDKFKDDTADVVLNLFQCIDLHDEETGHHRFADYIMKYKDDKSRYETENRILKNDDFIGRKEIVDKIMLYFSQQVKGVILCGMSGIGKTAVANEVAWKLKCQRPPWKIVRMSEMEKTSIGDLYKDLIFSLLDAFESDLKMKVEDDLISLKKNLYFVFTKVIADSIQNTLIYIDNVDDQCLDRQQRREFENFLREMTQLICKAKVKVCLLFTVQRRVFGEFDLDKDEFKWGSGEIVQLEVKPLSDKDASMMLRNLIKHTHIVLTDEQCSRINTSVGGNPMALIQLANNLPFVESYHNFIEGLLSRIFGPNEVLYDQLEKAIARLDPQCTDIEVLVNLSLFKTAWFSFEEASHIGLRELDKDSYVYKYNKKHERNTRTILSLLSLKSQHLIEIDKLSLNTVDDEKSKAMRFTRYGYCLHPLIYRHLQQKYFENSNEKECAKQTSLDNARLRFMQYFCKKIDKFGEIYNIKPHEAQAMLERSKVHLKSFYEYFLNGTVKIDEIMKDSDSKKELSVDILDCKRCALWKMLAYVQTAETKINFAKRLSADAERDQNQYVYVYWKCKEVEFLLAAGKTGLACNTFTDLSNKLGVVSDDTDKDNKTLLEQQSSWKLEEIERCPMLGIYFETKARKLKEENCKNPEILECLKKAKVMYKKSKKKSIKKHYQSLRQEDIARVVNLHGNFYFANDDIEKSRICHEEALCIIQGNDRCSINMNEFREFKHPSSSEYLTNIAACEHELGRANSDPDKRKELLGSAKEKYTFCIEYDRTMKRDFLQSHATTLMNRAEIYNLLKDLDSALQDAGKALKIFKEFYSMPNTTKTLSCAQVGYFCYKKGKKSKDPDERKEFLRKSVDLYDDALFDITRGGLPFDHKEFKDIKDFHKKAMEAAGMSETDIQQRIRRYSDFVLGKYDKIISRIKGTEPGRSIQTVLQECGAQGSVGMVVPGTYVDSSKENIGEEEQDADSMRSDDQEDDSSKSSNDEEMFGDDIDEIIAPKGDGIDEIIAPKGDGIDEIIAQQIIRQRRDSGMEDEEPDMEQDNYDDVKQHQNETEPELEVKDTEVIYNSGESAQSRSEEEVEIDIELDNSDNIEQAVKDTEVKYNSEKLPQTSKRILKKQDSFDIDNQADLPGQSSSMIGFYSGDVDELQEEQRRKKRKSSQESGIIEGSRLSSSTNRSSLSSIGSQDSVTSLLGRRLVLQSELSLHQEDESTAIEDKTDG